MPVRSVRARDLNVMLIIIRFSPCNYYSFTYVQYPQQVPEHHQGAELTNVSDVDLHLGGVEGNELSEVSLVRCVRVCKRTYACMGVGGCECAVCARANATTLLQPHPRQPLII